MYIVNTDAASSATTSDSQMPFKPKIIGRSSTEPISKRSVLINEISAEVAPSLNEVKNAEP